MRQALFTGTAQLPEIPLSSELPQLPGIHTKGSIQFGVDRGAVGLVRELLECAVNAYGCVTRIVTGGDAPVFSAALGLPAAAPEFTLHGIRLARSRCRD